MIILAKYGVAITIQFPMIKRGVVDFAVSADWTPAAGDTKISKDNGNGANTTNNPSVMTGINTWSLALTATEMQAAKIVITIVDSPTKAVEDQCIEIYTFGNASAHITGDLDNLDAAVSTRSSHAAADVWSVGTRTLTSFGTLVSDIWSNASRTLTGLGSSLVAEIWNALTSGMTTVGSVGKRIADNLDATITSRSTLTAGDVWTNATRTLTSFGTLVSDMWANATRTLTGFGTLIADIWGHDLSTTDEDVITGRKGASVLMALFKRFYHKVTQSGTQQIVYKADNTTAFATMSTTEGPPQEKGKAA